MLLPDWLSRRAAGSGNAVAVAGLTTEITYARLWESARAHARGLQSLGVQKGHRVAVLMHSGIQFALALHSIIQAGAIIVPINWRLKPGEIAWQLTDSGCALLLTDDGCEPLANAVADECQVRVMLLSSFAEMVNESPVAIESVVKDTVDTEDVLAIMYTSGTTGHPKGTMLTYGNFFWSASASCLQLGLNHRDCWLVPMPLFHVGGLSVLIRSVIYGTTAMVHDSFDVDAVHNAIENQGVTLISVVPVMLSRMLKARQGRPYASQLRCVLLGGSAASRSLLEQCRDLNVPVAQSYGMTETTSQAATLFPGDGLRKLGSSGRPLLTTEIRIVRDGLVVPPGESGEIIVRGPTVTKGYWNRPDATADAIRDGWLYTGDMGQWDSEGFLYVLDRRTDLIVSGGENVYPAEVESILLSHPDVAEAGVVPLSDEEWGQVPCAFVHLTENASVTAHELQAFCRQHLAGFKVPRQFRFVDSLPRNASGKLLRRTLKTWLESS